MIFLKGNLIEFEKEFITDQLQIHSENNISEQSVIFLQSRAKNKNLLLISIPKLVSILASILHKVNNSIFINIRYFVFRSLSGKRGYGEFSNSRAEKRPEFIGRPVFKSIFQLDEGLTVAYSS